MDSLDQQILAELTADGRATYATIGGVVGLSAPAVKRRVDRLLDDGVIDHFTAVVDPAALGWGIEALIDVYCQGRIAPADLRSAWEPIPEIVQASTVAGSADAVLRVRARDVAHLEETLENIRDSADIERTESTIVLSRLIERG
ncbi:AsnC family transcriptional regulator [Serinibacter arcticus]|uniref:AsnC family transcriptional regulator n=1 Tax=Serinibacter arcticus TaxID=1655435 RepID=A0A2U1ZX88_9MICO|nr:Lrp/AsnC family transcriptional regulator [Serinibacter arcticus]PWD51598.1 AsnC family transcriptional regulator [Serinibacter arcticus]